MTWTIDEVDARSGEWRDLCAQTQHLVFHEPEFEPVLKRGVSDETLAFVLKEDGVPRAGALGIVVKAGVLRTGYFSYPYGGFIGELPDSDTLRALLLLFARTKKLCQLQFVGYPHETERDWSGFSIVPDATNILPLEGLTPESLLASYKRVRRQEIKRAWKRGVSVEVRNDEASIEALYRFYLETMRRTGGIARYKPALIRAIVEELAPSGKVRLSVALAEGEAVGAMLVVDSDELTHGLVLVSGAKGRAYEANKVLLHTAVEDAIKLGKKGFDFMPSGQSAKGVAQFKTLWHTDEVSLLHRTLVVHPVRARMWRTVLAAAKRWPMRQAIAWKRGRAS